MPISFDNVNRIWYCECEKSAFNPTALRVEVMPRGNIFVVCPVCESYKEIGFED